MKTLASLAIPQRIKLSHELALARVEPLEPEERALAEQVRKRLLEDRHLVVELHGSDTSDSLRTLVGLASLRLGLMHGYLNPLEVGEDIAALAAKLLARVAAAEQAEIEALRAEGLDPDTDLDHRTLLALHPNPGTPPNADPAGELGTLVAAWERRRARPRSTEEWWAQKWTQNVQFFRVFFLAPLYLARRNRIHALLPASVRANATMRETFSALEQLGPILDNFVFDRGLRATFRDSTAICDLSFLYMQLADELVDNLVKNAGRDGVLRLLDRHYAPSQRDAVFIPLEDLDEQGLRDVGVDPRTPIVKYGIDHAAMLSVLRELHAVIRRTIEGSPDGRSVEPFVRDFFHHCFATFLDELHLPDAAPGVPLDRLPLADVAWHFFRKNNVVMTKWLAIRARLLGLDPRDLPEVIARWGYVLANFQIFDDMKDLAVDLGFQPSYTLEIAWHRFPSEYAWLEGSFGVREKSVDRNDVPLLSVRMARTILECMRFSKLIALAHFEWFTSYVWDYRWRRNWLLRSRSFHLPPPRDLPIEEGALAEWKDAITTGHPAIDAVFRFVAATRETGLELGLSNEYLAYVLDSVGYDHDGAIYAALVPRIRTIYRFMNLRMAMPSWEKADVLRVLLRAHREEAIRGLVALRLATGDLRLAHALARRIGLPLPRIG